ncbi:carboxymuconolactone decarboxylase family protein [Kitasatospora sp. NPDC087315]|uniref:carboxymuconolactone decarboxylase family protein n=1 Tax=Kitasatospora sp. NPDC087315 TaxID=3364069 RepID=UPI0038202643
MHRRIVQRGLRNLSLAQIRHVSPAGYHSGGLPVRRVYREVERDFGVLAPPIALHSPAPDVMTASWLILRASLVAPGRARRAAKEAVAVAVSEANSCPFCVRMHAATLAVLLPGGGAGPGQPATVAGGDGLPDPIPADEVPELIGTLVVMHYLNRMVNVFLSEVPLPPGAPRTSLGPVLRVLTWLIRSAGRTASPRSRNHGLLPAAELPEDLRWAAGEPSVADAFARACAALDEAGRRAVPAAVRTVVTAELDQWDGQPPGLGTPWPERALAGLSAEDRPAGRLALLSAMASYRVDDRTVAAARPGRTDRDIVEITAWASFEAARRIGDRTYRQTGRKDVTGH